MTNQLIAARDRFAAAHPEKRVVLNGRDWGVLDVGAGPVLLLIPGTLGRGDVFWQQIEALSGRLRLIAVSYPDSGGVADWATDLDQLLNGLGIGNVNVLGSSLGGYLAQFFAGQYPHRVAKLFAANTLHSVIGLDQNPPYSLDLMHDPIDRLRAGFAHGLGGWAQMHPDQADLVELLLQEAGGRILEGELRARLAAIKNGPELPPNRSDVVTIEAADDPLIPPQMRAAVRARLSPVVSYRFLWGGHFPYVVRPALYTALIEQTLGLVTTGPDWGVGDVRSR